MGLSSAQALRSLGATMQTAMILAHAWHLWHLRMQVAPRLLAAHLKAGPTVLGVGNTSNVGRPPATPGPSADMAVPGVTAPSLLPCMGVLTAVREAGDWGCSANSAARSSYPDVATCTHDQLHVNWAC